MCVLAGVLVVAGLGSPGVARAASPAGGGGLAEQVQLALNQLGVASQGDRGFSSAGSGMSLNIPSAIPWGGAVPVSVAGAITTSVAAATEPVTTTTSDPASTLWAGIGSPPSAPPGTGFSGQERGAAENTGQPERAQGAGARAASRSEVRQPGITGIATVVPQSSVAALRGTLVAHGLGQARAHKARAKPASPPAGVVPQQLPPRPLPPRPDMTSPGQASGQGPSVPLPLVALAAVLSFLALRFLPRALPVPAFRKPRLTVTTAWKPG